MNKHIIKIFSLIISIGLWFYVLNSEAVNDEKKVGITYVLPDDMAFSSNPPVEMKIKLLGPKAFMRSLMERDDRLIVDFNLEKKLKGNKYNIEFNESYFPLPLGVNIIEFEIPKGTFKLSKAITKDIPIHMNLVGKINENRKLVSSSVNPHFLKVKGSKSVLKNFTKVQTRPVDLSQLDGEGQLDLALIDIPSGVEIIEDDIVSFNYRLVPKEINFSLNNIPIRFLTSKRVLKSSKRKASLLVYLDNEDQKITEKDVQVIADIPEGARGNVTVQLRAKLVDGVHLIKINPEEIVVNVK